MNNLHNKSGVDEELAEKINQVFSIYDIQHENDTIYFFGVPKEDIRIIYQKLWPAFTEKNYQLSVKYELGEHMLIASPFSPARERRWINVALAIATFITTMVMGSFLFGAYPTLSNPYEVFKGIPFTIAIMAVLGSHEAGHYLIAKKHGMRTSLPYFIPFPSIIGTMGAVIKHRGPIPSRTALFDVGISGPLIGLFVSIVVTIIGLLQPPVHISEGFQLQLGIPPLFEFITRFIPVDDAAALHPVAFAGWVGMFVTALNLIPAGQLDGGHVLRAMLGEKARHVSTIMPFLLISLGFYVTYFLNRDGFLWVLWGLFLSFFAAAGHPKPLNDEVPLGKGRMALGILAFILGLLSLTVVPFQMH
jgi:membrane-associated protease RseP (regulator of RpoE activity)